MGKVCTPQVGCAGDVGKVKFRVRLQVGGIASGECAQRTCTPCRKRHYVQAVSCFVALGYSRRLFHNQVRVGAAQPKGTDASNPRATAHRPCGQLPGNVDRPAQRGNVGVECGQVEVRRNLIVLERKHSLDEPGNSCGRLSMTQVRLHRADQQRVLGRATCAQHLHERAYFNGIT